MMSNRRLTVFSGAPTPWYLAGGAPTPVAAYKPKGAASLAVSYVNLANPGTYDCALGVAPTWDATNGWIFNGSTQYLNTGVQVALGYSAIIRYSTVTNFDTWIFGKFGGAFGFVPRQGGGNVQYQYSATKTVAPGAASGVFAITKDYGYRNGVSDVAIGASSLSLGTFNVYVGARNNGGTVDLFCAGYVQAFAIYSTTLSDTQVAAISAAMAAL